MVCSERRSALLMGFGSFFTVMGAISVIFWPSIFFAQLKNMMIVTNTSMSYDMWRETPIPMYLECYMWNITNVEAILNGTAEKVEVTEMGPYVFSDTHIKTNITFNDNNTVTFFNQRYWHFVPEMSNGSISDNITSINPIIATVAYFMRKSSIFLKLPVELFLRRYHNHMFLTANVSAWLFDGIEDPVLDLVTELNLPFNIPFDRFGWFYDRNGSMEFDGVFVMNTGAVDFSQLGMVEMWRHSPQTVYRGECGAVKGSTGELWAPELGQPEIVIFSSDLCTYLSLAKNDTVLIDGIEGVMYAANDSVFDNGYKYPSMACYCGEVRDDECLPAGALNVSACRYGAPAFVTQPRMYNTDPYYPAKIAGQHPTDDNQFRIALEMFTGIPLYVAAQLQINLLVRHVTGIPINNALPDGDTLVPMFWFRQEVRITDEFASMARMALNLRYGVPYGMYALTGIGLLLLMCGIFILVRRLLRSPDTAPIMSDSQQDDAQ